MNIEDLKRQIDFFYENASRYGVDNTQDTFIGIPYKCGGVIKISEVSNIFSGSSANGRKFIFLGAEFEKEPEKPKEPEPKETQEIQELKKTIEDLKKQLEGKTNGNDKIKTPRAKKNP